MTGEEGLRFAADAALLGERVAYWLSRESQGWSALDETIYWLRIDKTETKNPKAMWSPYEAA
jgi:hypothetical protein